MDVLKVIRSQLGSDGTLAISFTAENVGFATIPIESWDDALKYSGCLKSLGIIEESLPNYNFIWVRIAGL